MPLAVDRRLARVVPLGVVERLRRVVGLDAVADDAPDPGDHLGDRAFGVRRRPERMAGPRPERDDVPEEPDPLARGRVGDRRAEVGQEADGHYGGEVGAGIGEPLEVRVADGVHLEEHLVAQQHEERRGDDAEHRPA